MVVDGDLWRTYGSAMEARSMDEAWGRGREREAYWLAIRLSSSPSFCQHGFVWRFRLVFNTGNGGFVGKRDHANEHAFCIYGKRAWLITGYFGKLMNIEKLRGDWQLYSQWLLCSCSVSHTVRTN